MSERSSREAPAFRMAPEDWMITATVIGAIIGIILVFSSGKVVGWGQIIVGGIPGAFGGFLLCLITFLLKGVLEIILGLFKSE